MAVAGKVAITPKGDYDKNATYKRLDCVKYYNVMYVAKKDVPKGIELTNEEYWMKGIEGNGSGGAGIDDSQVSTLTTYSSSKITDLTDEINNSLEEKASEINDNVDTKLEDKLDKIDGDISETVAGTADIPEIRTIPTVGDKFKAIFGKTIKYFQDLKTIAFTGNYEDLLNKPTIPTVTNNLLATNPGTALDAVQGKAISDVLGSTDISGIGDGTITNAISMLNSDKLKVVKINSNNLNPQIMAVANLGQTSKVATITFRISDQAAWLFGSGSEQTSNFMYQLGTRATMDYNFGKNSLSITHDSNNSATFTTPAWFRGVIISYNAFNISII